MDSQYVKPVLIIEYPLLMEINVFVQLISMKLLRDNAKLVVKDVKPVPVQQIAPCVDFRLLMLVMELASVLKVASFNYKITCWLVNFVTVIA